MSDEFLAEVRGLPHRNLAVELLRKLLNDELKLRTRRNIVQSRAFSDMLEKSVARYHNRTVETAQVIEELIALAKDIRAARARGEESGLSDEEIAFYDALAENDSARDAMGEPALRVIAHELVTVIKGSVSIDWMHRDDVVQTLRNNLAHPV